MIKGYTLLTLSVLLTCLFSQAQQGVQLSVTPASQTVTQGGTISFRISVAGLGGFSQQVFFTDTSDVLGRLNISRSPASLYYPYDTAVMTVNVTGTVPAGQHWVKVKAGNGPVSDVDTVYLNVLADSCTWTNVLPTIGNGIPNGPYMTHLVTDTNGTVWAGGYTFGKWDGSNWVSYSPGAEIFDLCVSKSNAIWAATARGVASFDGTYWSVYDTSNTALTTNAISSISFDASGTLWVGTDKGVFTKTGNTWININTGLPKLQVKKIRVAPSGDVYVLTNNPDGNHSFSVYGSGAWHPLVRLNKCINSNQSLIGEFVLDKDDNIWMSSCDYASEHIGLIKYNGHVLEQWLYKELPNNHLIKNLDKVVLYQDSSSALPGYDLHTLYINSHNQVLGSVFTTIPGSNKGNGFISFNSRDMKHYNSANSTFPSDDCVFAMTDGGGKHWVIHGGGGLTYPSPYKGMAYSDCAYSGAIPPAGDCSAHFTLYEDTLVAHHWYALYEATGSGAFTYSWDWGDGTSLSVGSSPSHIYSDSGYYHICLTITDATGCAASYCDSSTYIRSPKGLMISVNAVTSLPVATSLQTVESSAPVVSVYPNPAATGFTLETNYTGTQLLRVFDMSGQMVLSEQIRNNKTRLNTDKLSVGIYILSLQTSSGIITRKLVVER